MIAVSDVQKHMKSTSAAAIAFLERRSSARWSRTQRIESEHKSSIGVPFAINVIAHDRSEEELNELASPQAKELAPRAGQSDQARPWRTFVASVRSARCRMSLEPRGDKVILLELSTEDARLLCDAGVAPTRIAFNSRYPPVAMAEIHVG